MPELPGLWNLTPWGALLGLLVGLFYMLARRALYTLGSHDEIVGLYKERIKALEAQHDVDVAQHQADQAIKLELIKQNSAALEGNKISEWVVGKIFPGRFKDIEDSISRLDGTDNVAV
jgi:hypothetical protein